MTDKERYERVMRQDFPRDFVDDAYLDAWEKVLCGKSCSTTTTACRMPKSGGAKKMANTNNASHSYDDKVAYFKGRVDDVSLTAGQRRYAANRLLSLCRDNKPKVKACPQSSAPIPTSTDKYTDGQKFAYGAGVGFAKAKSGERVPVKPENVESFRKGFERGKRRKKK